MKNILIFITCIVIIPSSFGSSENQGCNSKKTKSEDRTERSAEKKDDSESKGKKAGENSISSYPFYSID